MQLYLSNHVQTSTILPPSDDAPECETTAKPLAPSLPRRISRSKDELAYWKAAIRRVPDSPYWYAELQRGGVRRKVSLETSNKAAAAHRARELWYEVRALGWKGYLAKYKPESLPNPDPSIGAFLAQVEKTANLSPATLRSYVSALRKITSDVAGLSDDASRFGHGKGRKAWLEKVNAVKLSVLSTEAIQRWKISFINQAKDPVALRSRRVSCNSFLRGARSLFAPGIVKHLGGIELPPVLPFSDIEFESKVGSKYRSDIDLPALIQSATKELASPQPEAFKIFALATFAGLRRREIDLLTWTAFDWTRGVVSITPTAHFSAKSEDSYNDVPLDPEVLALFRQYRETATSEFVIAGEPPRQTTYNFYRAQEHFEQLTIWLRSKGVQAKKPVHVLRKEFGSQLCQVHGIYAASRGLRHSSIAISAAFYTDSKAKKSVGLGHLLESKVVPFQQEVA